MTNQTEMTEIVEKDNFIDFVIAWVDGSDEKWQKTKQAVCPLTEASDSVRYRDWGFLPYVLRSIELYAPWVHKIYIVTAGQVPSCLQENELSNEKTFFSDVMKKKIVVMDHIQFIPDAYLPTFNSNTIELNLHRIAQLSEQFVYFNDDFFLTRPMAPTDFFQNHKPVDMACLNGINGKDNVFAGILFHNMALVSQHYDIKVVRKNLRKWMHVSYGKHNLRTLLLLPFHRLQGIYNPHGPIPLLKTTYETVWERDGAILDRTCLCKTRNESNVSVYAMRYEQLLSNNFIPAKSENRYLEVTDDLHKIKKAMQKAKSVCINDVDMPKEDFEIKHRELEALLKDIYQMEC